MIDKIQNYCVKHVSLNFNKDKAEKIFKDNVITYFSSYRYESPGYLNDPYEINLEFKKKDQFSGYLGNPIEVRTCLLQLANWVMDIVLDLKVTEAKQEAVLLGNINNIFTQTLVSKQLGAVRVGIGQRSFGSTRIQIVKKETVQTVYPTIFNLSSGEAAMFCLFGEILRQADNNKNNILLEGITGIVLVDEVDKHLHIKLQKEILPKLLDIFPNVQFILSSHSPFLNMGLAAVAKERAKIVELNNFGVSTDPTANELYDEVYKMMISENDRFKEAYDSLKETIKSGKKPLIITEGKTDMMYLKKAKEKLEIEDCDIDFFDFGQEKSFGNKEFRKIVRIYFKNYTRKKNNRNF